MKSRLEILIPYSPEHKHLADLLVIELRSQIVKAGVSDKCRILDWPDIFCNRGKIRNYMLSLSNADYVAFFDADDKPASDYITRILKALELNPDCCSLTGVITTDGANPEIFDHSIKYPAYKTNDTGEIKYERYPNHLNVIKSSIAKQFLFPEIDHGEDTDWATQIFKSGLLKTEATIPGILYHYQYVTKK